MRLTRYLRPEQIRLELNTTTPPEAPEGWSRERFAWSVKEKVLEELVELFDGSGRVSNRSKLLTDLLNRERKATTGLGEGFALPHVRTMQTRDLILICARSTAGVEFMASDGQPVHVFVGVVAPRYADKLYQQVYPQIAKVFARPQAREQLLEAKDEHEIIKLLSDTEQWDTL